MLINKICMGCMEEKGNSKVCPKCGWVEGTETESPLHLKPGTILKGQYLIGKVLGHGGFGITYLASDINLGLKLAIKEYFPQGMATRNTGDAIISVYSGGTKQNFEYGLEKFLEEGRTLAKFDGISEIVTAKDFFKENGTAYLVMSYIEGITLLQYLEQNGGRLPLDAVLNIMLPIMKALKTVHTAGILHRDISPDNIYITKNFNVKLLDFGAARYEMGEHSKSLSVILKPGYAPEEQYRSKGKQGPWTDVYAVGATMYKALTGETPPEALDRADEDSIVRPTALGVEMNQSFENALMKALSVKAAGRFQNIDEFEAELFREIPRDISGDNAKGYSPPQEEGNNELKNKENTAHKLQENINSKSRNRNWYAAIVLAVLILIIVSIEAYQAGISNNKTENTTSVDVSKGNLTAYSTGTSTDTQKQENTTVDVRKNSPTPPTLDKLDQNKFSMAGAINGNLYIHMNIYCNKKTVTGTYYYDKYKTNIELKGSYDNNNNINLNEFDNNGNMTGTFKGIISDSGEFTGNWSNAAGTNSFPFSVSTNNQSAAAAANSSAASDFIFPSSSTVLLTQNEVTALPKDKLAIARNEIYARHGYIFSLQSYKDYFQSKSWYVPNPSFKGTDEELNNNEISNIKLIKSIEENTGN